MASSDGDRSVMSEVEKRLCHQVLYDFFHGRVSNPVEAGQLMMHCTLDVLHA